MSRVVVITGAGSGIGRATALRFARLGDHVHAADLDEAAAGETVASIEADGGRATAHGVDVTDAEAVDRLAADVFEAHGAVDLLHNNAGIGVSGPAEHHTLEDWRRVIEVDLMGVIHGIHAFLPRLLAQGRPAVIVNTASMAGLLPAPNLSAYGAAKHGVVGLSESLNVELAPRGIRVCALCPGVINTPIARATPQRGGLATPEGAARTFERFGVDPDVVARTVVELADRPRVIATVPRRHVVPGWALWRLSPRLAQPVLRLGTKLSTRQMAKRS